MQQDLLPLLRMTTGIVKLTERRDAQYNKVKKQAAVLTKARTEIAREVEQQMAAV